LVNLNHVQFNQNFSYSQLFGVFNMNKDVIKTILPLLLAFTLASCSSSRKAERYTEPSIEAVSEDIDATPEPVGGMEAIQAAVREPEEVSKGNKEGEVIVEATINSEGRVVSTKIAQSSGFEGMDSEAMLAVARAAWKPARKDGRPITATVRVPVVFQKIN
jgi:protein TonB